MGQRNKVVLLTKEAKILKQIREKHGISLRKLSAKMEISFMRVHQMESGRDNIPDSYVSKFLKAIGLTYLDWEKELNPEKDCSLREQCHVLIDNLPIHQLNNVTDFLAKISHA